MSPEILMQFAPIIFLFVIFYFLLIRPQKKKQKEHQNMLASLHRGDRIITAGGFFGIVRDVKDDSFIIELADGVKTRIAKGSISVKIGEEEKIEHTPEIDPQ